jgi:hypothetical protein
MRFTPIFDLVARLGVLVAAPNSGVVINMFASMLRYCLVALEDADLVIVHVASPVSRTGIAPKCRNGTSNFLCDPLKLE